MPSSIPRSKHPPIGLVIAAAVRLRQLSFESQRDAGRRRRPCQLQLAQRGVAVHGLRMSRFFAAVLVLLPATALAQVVPPGGWDVTSTVVDLTAPGVPGFIARMVRGKSKAEHKHLTSGQGIEALLAPDPKAQCRVDSQVVMNGRYAQALTCPQKKGDPVHIARSGTYDTTGFVGRATVTGTTAKGPMRVVLDQRAARVSG